MIKEINKINVERIKNERPIKELLNFSIINIDKPRGPTSFDVDIIVKNNLNLSKTSHFGTLDPQVTGVLPVALGRACRLMNYFIGHKKEYVGLMHLHEKISEKKLKEEMEKFIGQIDQLPPVKSRVKRQIRKREVYGFEILEISEDSKDVLFKSEVEAGTYIRKLISDLGDKIGGAHMIELRRTKASIFEEKDSINLYDFEKAVKEYEINNNEKELRKILIPGEIISEVLPIVFVKNDRNFIEKLYHGSPLFKSFILDIEKNKLNFKKDDKIAVFCDDNFIGVFSVIEHATVLAKPEFVMQPLQEK